MKLTYEKQSTPPIAKIQDTKKYIYVADVADDENDINELTIPANQKFVPLPYILPNQRQSVFVSGPSGVGKSYWSASYIKHLRDATRYKDNKKKKLPVYYFTAQKIDDPAYKDIKNFNKVDIYNEKLFQLKVEDLENSITLWDDWDQGPKAITQFLYQLLRGVLELGRKLNIHVIVLTHETLAGAFTKPIILESQAYVLFPRLSYRTASRFLKDYMGFDKNELQDIKKINSRSVYINKQHPQYLVADHKVKFL